MQVERWALESDLHSITTTGKWVDDVTPEWALEEARKTGRDPKDPRTIYAGYNLLVKKLHDELTIQTDRVDTYRAMREGSDW